MAVEIHPLPAKLRRAGIGARSVYYRLTPDDVRVSDEAVALTSGSTSFDIERLAALIAQANPADDGATVFRDVHRVPAGKIVDVVSGGFEEVFETTPPTEDDGSPPITLAARLWSDLRRSVERSMEGAKRVAVLTGGGVDSSVLFALARIVGLERGIRVDAVALDFGGDGDDRPHLRALESHLGIRAHRIDPRDAGSFILPLSTFALPTWSPTTAIDRLMFARAKDLGADRVLLGLGGDDLFDGEHPKRGLRRWLYPLLPPAVVRARRRRLHASWFPWAGPNLASFLDREASTFRRRSLATAKARFEAFSRASYLLDSLELSYSTASTVGLVVEHPYLSTELVASVAKIPNRVLQHGGRLRGLFRLAARGHIPDSLRLRTDKASFHEALRAALDAAGGAKILRELATVTELEKLGLVDSARFFTKFREFESHWRSDELQWGTIWPALAVEAFVRARASIAAA